VAVAIGGVAFAAGRLTAPVAAAVTGANGQAGTGQGNGRFGNGAFPGASGAPGNGFGRGGGLGAGGAAGVTIEGTVTEVTADHLSIQLASGATVQIPISSTTTYHRQSDATSSDVKSGTSVLVRVQGRFGGGNGGAAGSPTPSSSSAASGAPGGFFGTASDVTVVRP
jgi:hypothetical protein